MTPMHPMGSIAQPSCQRRMTIKLGCWSAYGICGSYSHEGFTLKYSQTHHDRQTGNDSRLPPSRDPSPPSLEIGLSAPDTVL